MERDLSKHHIFNILQEMRMLIDAYKVRKILFIWFYIIKLQGLLSMKKEGWGNIVNVK